MSLVSALLPRKCSMMHRVTVSFSSTFVGPTWKSVFTFWNFIHHVGAGFRWRTIPCAIEDSTSCNDGIVKSSFIFERIFLFDNEARTITFYKEGLIYSEYSRLFNLHSKPLFLTWFKLFLLLIEYMLRYLRKVLPFSSFFLFFFFAPGGKSYSEYSGPVFL